MLHGLILFADGFDDLQLFVPWYRLLEEGLRVTLATPTGRPATGKRGHKVPADYSINALVKTYDLLVIPGGESPAKLRLREVAVDITRTFMETGYRVAAIGEGAQLLISAGCLDGRAVTCAPAIRDDVRAAGAEYHDEPAFSDGNLVTGRGSADLPAFARSLVGLLGVRA